MSSGILASNDDHPLEVGVVYESTSGSGCAHEFRLAKLVRYLDGTDTPENFPGSKRKDQCLECQKSIVMVCDKAVVRTSPETSETRTISFRYGKQTYRLAVDNSNKWWWNRLVGDLTAQARIADCLGMNAKTGMKILCKGKVIHPSGQRSQQETSVQLLEISRKDWESTKKPSLVVMGTRAGQEVREKSGLFNLIYSVSYGAVHWSVTVALQIFGALLWPLRSVGLLPPPSRNERRED